MLSIPGLDSEHYWQRLSSGARGGDLPEALCPSCQRGCLRGHGWYSRRLAGETVRIRRLRCSFCRATHALLPEDLCAYRDLRLQDIERSLAQDSADSASPPVLWQSQLRFLLPATSGSLLDRARAIVGGDSGSTLVRLRHWIWRHYRYFLSGFAGLFRGGRPHRHVGGHSTNLQVI